MSEFSTLTAAVNRLKPASGVLTVGRADFALPETDAFFLNVIGADQVVLTNASLKVEAASVSIGGTTNVMGYPDVAAEMIFEASKDDTGADTIVCRLEGILSGTYRLPLIHWVDVERAGISVALLQPFDLVRLAFTADLVVCGSPRAVVPVRIAQVGAGAWQCGIDVDAAGGRGGPTSVTAQDLVALLGGSALAAFLPEVLADALEGLQVIDLAAVIEPALGRILTFSVAVQVGNGWPDIVPGFGLTNLQLVLTLIDPLSASSRRTIGAIRGTLRIRDVDVPILVQAAMAAGSTAWEFGLDRDPAKYPPDGRVGVVLPTVADLLSLVSSTAADDLPAGLRHLPQVAATNLSVGLSTSRTSSRLRSLAFAATTVSPWEMIEGFFAIENVSLALTVAQPASGPLLFDGVVSGTFSLSDTVYLFVSVARGSNGWTLSGGLAPGHSVNLTEIVGRLLTDRLTLPSSLPDVVFTTVTVSAVPGRSFQLDAGSTTPWHLLGSLSLDTFDLSVGYQGGDATAAIHGSLTIGPARFDVAFDMRPGATTFTAKWTGAASPLGFADIARAVGWDDMPAVPEGLDLRLTQVDFTYDYEDASLALSARSLSYGRVVFVTRTDGAQASGPRRHVFAIDVPLDLDLSHLPVVGSRLPAEGALGISSVQIIVSSAPLDAAGLAAMNASIARLGGTPLAPTVLTAGVSLSATVRMGNGSQSLVAPLAVRDAAPVGRPAPAVPAYGAGAKWLDVGKAFGPVHVQRVGMQYQDSRLFFLLDAALQLSALSLTCQGLGVGSPLTSFKPIFHLDGIATDVSAGPVTISGGLLSLSPEALVREDATLPKGEDIDFEYLGAVTIKVQPYMIAGVASYAKVTDAAGATSPSFFLFAEIAGAFGGPPAFFVTGAMGGFGFNSRLSLPAPDAVYRFPFVAGLDDPIIFGGDPTPMGALAVLSGSGTLPAVVTPSIGDDWLAAGIMFSSFELIIGHALVAAEFGRSFEVALLGLASTSLPQGSSTEAYAFIELQLEAIFKPEEGYVGIFASLTPSSFVLTRQCHLTGGFAFCLWFGPSPHEGDFVVTVGGYHPAFSPPSWYPRVLPVGFNWPVDGHIAIKGGTYCALTPGSVMAGGSLEALYEWGDVKAWFIADANLLIDWKPFHFSAEIGLSIGAAVRVDLLFTSVTLTYEVGATLKLWGPPTGGIVHVHLHVLSFSIPFGSGREAATPKPLDWAGFTTLLPRAGASAAARLAAAPDTTGADLRVLTLHVNGGLSSQVDDLWHVRGDEFCFVTQSAVPATDLVFAGGDTPIIAAGAAPASAPASIAIRPMGVASATSVQTVKLTFVDANRTESLAAWTQVPQTANLPDALWGHPNGSPSPRSATVGSLTGVRLIAPAARVGASPGSMQMGELVDGLGQGALPLAPASDVDPVAAPEDDSASDPIRIIADTLGAEATASAQQALLAALAAMQAPPPSSAQLTRLAAEAGRTFSQAPLLVPQAPPRAA